MSNIVDVVETFDRGKILDEGVFLAICGLDLCRDGLQILGVVRLEMAVHNLQKTIDKINKDMDKTYTKKKEE